MFSRTPRKLFLATMALVAGVLAAADPAFAAPARSSVAISGTVYGARSAALARAKVVAYALPGLRAGCATSPDEWREIASTTSRSGGAFTVAGLAPGSYRIGVFPADLSVDSFGYRLATTFADATPDGANVTSWIGYANDVAAPSTGNDVRLAVPARITGIVTDESTGLGIAGVEVRAVSTGQWQRQYPAGTTNSTGAYAVPGLPLGAPDPDPGTEGNEAQRFGPVLVDTAGWHGVWMSWFDSVFGGPDTTVDLTDAAPDVYDKALRTGSRVVLDVVDPAGRPVAGLATTLDTAFPYPPVLTNAKGRAVLGHVGEPGQPLQVRVRATDYLGRYRDTWYPQAPVLELAQQLTLAAEGDELRLRMTVRKDAASIVGKVIFATGDAAPSTAVNAVLSPGSTQPWEWVAAGTSTHCDGTFELTGLWPGTTVQLMLTSPWDTITGSTVTPSSGANFVGPQKLPAWVVNGSVGDPEGTPLADIAVDLWTQDDTSSWVKAGASFAFANGTTDEWGQYRVFLPYEPWNGLKVSFSDPGGSWAPEFFDNVDYATPENAMDVVDDDPWNSWGYWSDVQLSPAA